jgi:hypothetical protein
MPQLDPRFQRDFHGFCEAIPDIRSRLLTFPLSDGDVDRAFTYPVLCTFLFWCYKNGRQAARCKELLVALHAPRFRPGDDEQGDNLLLR